MMKIALKILAALAALVVIAYLVLIYACGYFGGPLFFDIPARAPSHPGEERTVAVVFSGNMGFHIGQGVATADDLTRRGLPVVGVNSLTAFNRPRTAAEATSLVEAAIDRARRFSGRDRVALIGISFGADILHVGLAGLPPAYRARVRNVVLVVPGAILQLHASPLGILPIRAPDMDGRATGRRLDWVPATCIWGAEETDSLCPLLRQGNMAHVPLPGGHMLKRNVGVLAQKLADAIAAAPQDVPVNAAARPSGSGSSPRSPRAG